MTPESTEQLMSQANKLSVRRFVSSFLECNLYLLENDLGEVIIDPCLAYGEVYGNRNARIEAIIITHCHFDHIHEISSYLEKTSCPVYMHANGVDKLEDPRKNASALLGLELKFQVPEERIIAITGDGVHKLLGTEFYFLETPGHSDCSLSVLTGGNLFTGDTLFRGSVGRTDLETSDHETLKKSLDKLLSLGDYPVHPGHSAPTSLARERALNPYLRR